MISISFVNVLFMTFLLFIRVVNGALEYLSKDLGIVENTVLQGKLILQTFRVHLEQFFRVIIEI